MKTVKIISIATGLAFICAWNASAALIWQADFQSYGNGTSVTINSTGNDDTFSRLDQGTLTATTGVTGFADTVGLLAGTLNNAALDQSGLGAANFAGKAMIVSFDYQIVPSSTYNLSVRSLSAANTLGGKISTSFAQTGGSIAYEKVRITMVANTTGSSITLGNGLTLADGQIANYALKGASYINLTSAPLTSTTLAGFRVYAAGMSSTESGYIDNIGVWNDITDTVGGTNVMALAVGTIIPEPSTIGMLGLGALFIGLYRRMRQ